MPSPGHRRLLACACAGVALSAAAAPAAAADKAISVAFNVGANTNYEFRGVSQTDNDPSVFGGADVEFGSMLYAGTWVSNVDFGNGTDLEYDLYAGVKPTVGAVSFDFGLLFYGYAGSPGGSHQDYFEGKAAASIPLGPATFGAAVYYSPEFFGKTGDAWYYELNAAASIPNSKFSVSGAIGRQTVDIGPSYTTWNAGIGYALSDHIGFDVRYWDTAKDKFGKISSSTVVAGLKVTF